MGLTTNSEKIIVEMARRAAKAIGKRFSWKNTGEVIAEGILEDELKPLEGLIQLAEQAMTHLGFANPSCCVEISESLEKALADLGRGTEGDLNGV
jgi:hypothetical protein